MDLTIWMNMPSFYQGDLYRALVASGRINLQLLFARPISADRQQLGWQDSTDGFAHHFLASLGQAAWLAWQHRHRIHIVNGVWAEPKFLVALIVLALCGSRYLIYSEAPPPGRPPALKHFFQQTIGRWLVGRAAAILPISHFATDFYRQLGATHFYPFGYFRATPQLPPAPPKKEGVEFLYVGQLIQRKGLDLLLEAIHPLLASYPQLHLSLIGYGEQEPMLRQWIAEHQLAERITIHGPLPAGQIPARLQQANLFILPSRWDGWGLVVNEALAAGLPVVVSNACGAADLIASGRNGFIFASQNVADLGRCLRQFLEQPANWPTLQANAQTLGQALSTEVAAHYLLDCLEHLALLRPERPLPPWQSAIILSHNA